MVVTKWILCIGMLVVVVMVGCGHAPGTMTGHSMTASELHTQAVFSLLQGDHAAVVKYCTAAIELDPDNSAYYTTRASSLEAEKSWDLALADYGEMIRINPKDIMGLASRSRLYLQMGMPEQAALDYRAYAAAMTERDPHWPAEEAVRKICGELDGYEFEDYQKLSTREKAIWNVFWFHAEVMNGGLGQYFVNSAGDHAADCLATLEIIGATESAKLLRSGCMQFPNGIPDIDRDTRQKQLDGLLKDGEYFDDRIDGEIDPELFSLLLAHYNAASVSPNATE